MQKTDAVDLIRRPSLETRTFVCSGCKLAFTLDTPVPTGGVACARCGEHLGVGARVEYAAAWPRTGALVLDVAASLAPYFFLALVFMLFGDVIARDDEGNTTSGAKLALWTVASVVFGIYFLISQMLGESFGKRAMGCVSCGHRRGVGRGSPSGHCAGWRRC